MDEKDRAALRSLLLCFFLLTIGGIILTLLTAGYLYGLYFMERIPAYLVVFVVLAEVVALAEAQAWLIKWWWKRIHQQFS